jgi:hypothetical protein
MSGKHGTSWQPYEALGRLRPRSARRGRPGCFADLSLRRRRARRYSTRRYTEPGIGKISRARRSDYKLFLSFALPRDKSHRQWSPGEIRTTNIRRHEAEPAFSGAVIVATSLHAVDPMVDPNHDAVIRIGSEAPKQRCPFCNPAWKPLTFASNRYLGSLLAARRSGAPTCQIDDLLFLLFDDSAIDLVR